MKRIAFILTVGAAILTSCSDSANENEILPSLDVDLEATIESTFEDVDVLSDAGIDGTAESGRGERDFILECATVERDTVNRTIIIDYGEGCIGHGGRLRSGKIIITYSGLRFEPGSSRSITFDNFRVDSILVEGVRTVTNISDSITHSPTFSITLVGGKLTFLDGSYATRDAEHTRTWYRAENPIEDYTTLDGQASGITQEGLDYSVEITETLVFKRACLPGRVFVPVEGQKVLTVGENVEIINYGDGECDDLITVSRNGDTEERSVRIRRRRRG